MTTLTLDTIKPEYSVMVLNKKNESMPDGMVHVYDETTTGNEINNYVGVAMLTAEELAFVILRNKIYYSLEDMLNDH